jgi:hypothetical protein
MSNADAHQRAEVAGYNASGDVGTGPFFRPCGSGGGGSGGGNTTVNITNLSKTNAKAVDVQNGLRWIGAWLAEGFDPDCNSWLTNNLGSIQTLLGLTAGSSTMYVAVGNFSNNSVDAIAGVAGTDLAPSTALLTVNANGAYFNAGYTIAGTSYQSSTAMGDVLILLHELAHLTLAAGFVGNDNNTSDAASNNRLVLQHCTKTVQGLGSLGNN